MARRYTAEEVTRAETMWRDGAKRVEIADALGRSPMSIKTMMHNRRDRFPRRLPEITMETVKEMRRLRAVGSTYQTIADITGTSDTTAMRYTRNVKEER